MSQQHQNQTRGPATGRRIGTRASRPLGEVDATLGRGECTQAGVPGHEVAAFRDWARRNVPASYFDEEEPLARQRELLAFVEAWTGELRRAGATKRARAVEREWKASVDVHARAWRQHEARQTRRMPKLPKPAERGAVPDTVRAPRGHGSDELTEELPPAAPRARHARALAAASSEEERERLARDLDEDRDVDGESEPWDPAWGDPDEGMPGARPIGMRALPKEDTVIVPRPTQGDATTERVPPHVRSPNRKPRKPRG